MLQPLTHNPAVFRSVFAALALTCALLPFAQTRAATQPFPHKQAFAVVELFTSEGCSSCPSADQALSDLTAGAQKSGDRIFTLAFQVDYWNNLGWVDPYSSAAYSQRQSNYARVMRSDSVYTPQMIVNGSTQFIGSDRAAAQAPIKAALSSNAATGVAIQSHWAAGSAGKTGQLIIDCHLLDAPAGSVVQLALVERGLVDHVARGENAGRTLRHDNVVRAFEQHPAAPAFSIELKSPHDLKPANASIIAFVQDPATMRILGAEAVDVPPRP